MTTSKATYKCGHCGYSSLKIVDLHEHLLDHSGSVGYFFDICEKTACPKWKYDGSFVKLNAYTQTEDQHSQDDPEIKDENSTVVKTEVFEVDTDEQNDFEITSQEDIPDIGIDFYGKNQAFSGAGSSEVPSIPDHGYSIAVHNLPSLNCNSVQISKTMLGYKRTKKQNMTKQPKRARSIHTDVGTAERSHADTGSQSGVNVESEDAHGEEDELPLEYFNATDNVNEADQNDGNNVPVNKLVKPTGHELHMVGFTVKDTVKNTCVRKSLVCEICGIEVPNKWEWRDHRKSCGRKKHECKYCGKRFLRPYLVREHLRVHTGDRPMVCDKCGKAFKTARMLSFHLQQLHAKERNYKCDKCDKSFKVLPGLTRHLRIHNNLLDYSCQFCDKKFSTSWNLKAHIRQHTGIKPYTCFKCGESFTHNVSRKGHEAKCVFPPVVDNT